MSSGAARGRRPGPSDARDDILEAARSLFARHGYEKASLRAIARTAGVDPALIVHYFSSKEGLLREALTLPIDPSVVLAEGLAEVPDEEVGEHLVRLVVTLWDRPAVAQRMRSLLRVAMSHDHAMVVLREMIRRTVLVAVARLVEDDSSTVRTELVATQMLGVAMARLLLRLPELSQVGVDDLARMVGPTIQRYLVGPLAPTAAPGPASGPTDPA
jgi:AcrR family transcriptional regulator